MKRKMAIGLFAVISFWLLAAGFALSDESSALPPMGIRLIDVAQEAGVTLLNVTGDKTIDYIVEANGNGAAFFDFDNDEDIDLLIINGSTLNNIKNGGNPIAALYRNDGQGKFSDVTALSGINRKGWGMGVCVADYDNDGFEDVYITAFGPNVLYRNNGDGTFTDVTEQAKVGDTGWSTNCVFGDYDRDGYTDLYVANYLTFDEETIPKPGTATACRYKGMAVFCGPKGLPPQKDRLYRNNGDGIFIDVSERAGISAPGQFSFGVIFSDLNNDGWPDIFVANDSRPNYLFRNKGGGSFEETALLAGVALSESGAMQAGMGVDVGDYDNDGDFDIFITHLSGDHNTLYRNDGNGFLSDVSFHASLALSSLEYLGWGTGFVDLDNDGLLDIFIANGHVYQEIDTHNVGFKFFEPNQLYQNLGDGRFREVTKEIGGGLLIEKSSRGAAFGDIDNDGDLDILVINHNDRPTLLRNEVINGNHWITLRLVGTKSNRDAVGARITVKVGTLVQTAEVRSGGSYLSHNDSRVHFGLGKATRIERLEVRWPSGLVETFENLQADQFIKVKEGQGVSTIKVR